MAALQDLLNSGSDARMNLPGWAEGNWRWRCNEDVLTMAVRLDEILEPSVV
jgi:4-alpha-glucanotransferase